MNPQIPPSTDDDLTRAERELEPLYRRLPQDQPDAAIDAAVLAQARAAVSGPSRRRRTHWSVAFASAAVLVLAAGIVWRSGLAPVPSSAPVMPAASDATGQAITHRQPASEDIQNPNAPVPVVAEQSFAAPAKPDAGAGAPREALKAAGNTAASADSLYANAQRAAGAERRRAATPQVATAVDSGKTKAKQPSSARRTSAGTRATHEPILAKPTASPPAPPAAPAPALEPRQVAPRRVMQTAPLAAPAASSSRPTDADDTPAGRVKHIRQLLREGQRAQAADALRALHLEYPDYVLPRDLRKLQR